MRLWLALRTQQGVLRFVTIMKIPLQAFNYYSQRIFRRPSHTNLFFLRLSLGIFAVTSTTLIDTLLKQAAEIQKKWKYFWVYVHMQPTSTTKSHNFANSKHLWVLWFVTMLVNYLNVQGAKCLILVFCLPSLGMQHFAAVNIF